MAQRALRVAGVPEHYNFPWTKAVQLGDFTRNGVDLKWVSMPGGTGAMVQSVLAGDVDVAVALTEGIVAAIQSNSNVPMKYLGGFVTSPLRWMIATGSGNSIESLADLARIASRDTIRVSVSRLGSGSHLMAYLLALQLGWQIDKLHFVVNKDFRGMRNAVQHEPEAESRPCSSNVQPVPRGGADFFMWEWFMTKPFVDSCELRALGFLDSPWPCFGLLARTAWLDQPGNRSLVRDAFHVVSESASAFVSHEDTSCEDIAAHFGLQLDDAHAWMRTVRYGTELVASLPALRSVVKMLVACGVLPNLDERDQAGAHGYDLLSIVDTQLARVSMDSDSAPDEAHDVEHGVDERLNLPPGSNTGIGVAHALAVASGGSGWQRPRAISDGGVGLSAVPVARAPTMSRFVNKGAGTDSVNGAASYISWRTQKAAALEAVMSHLQSFGGIDTTGAPQAVAPAIPAPEAVNIMLRAARKEAMSSPGGRRDALPRADDFPRPTQLHGVLVDIG